MPIYEYRCVKCWHKFEELRSPKYRKEPAACPLCGAESRPVMSVPALELNPGTKLRKRLGRKKPPEGA